MSNVRRALREFLGCLSDFGEGRSTRKLELLNVLHRRRLSSASEVLQLHEGLCFLRAYPDDAQLLEQVEGMLAVFAGRSDLRKHTDALADTGIAGTPIYFRFFPAMAHWLARRWGAYLSIDWAEFDNAEKLEVWLPWLTSYCEMMGLDEYAFETREWIDRLKGPRQTDATFLLARLERMRMSPQTREVVVEDLDTPFCLWPGPDTPARTREKYERAAITYQTTPLASSRPSLDEIAEQKPPLRYLAPREGEKLIALARAAMATRSRDLDAFAYGSKHDVMLVDCVDGFEIACVGLSPERRFLLETMVGYLVLKNGVPIGYGAITCSFGSAEIAFTVFDTFRSGQASQIFGWVLAMAHHVFGADTITLDPYQIGKDNEDALRSGAWWFYQKLGFRPRHDVALGIMRRELKRMKARPRHRSSVATLERLAEHGLFLNLAEPREDVLGVLPLANVGLHCTKFLAERFGSDREGGARVCAQEACELLGLRTYGRLKPNERTAWRRWAPLVAILPNVARWGAANRRALAALIRAKGSAHELDYLRRFNAHSLLRKSLRRLAERES